MIDSTQADTLYARAAQRIGATSRDIRTMCEVRASSKNELKFLAEHKLLEMHDARREVRKTTGVGPRPGANGGKQNHRVEREIPESDFPMLLTSAHLDGDGIIRKSAKRYGIAGTILSLPGVHSFPACDAAIARASADTPTARAVLQLDVSRLIALTQPREGSSSTPPLLMMHGPSRCTSELYPGMGFAKQQEQCWRVAWARLLEHRTIFDPVCGPGGNSTRWCSAWINTSTACTRRVPLLPELSSRAPPPPPASVAGGKGGKGGGKSGRSSSSSSGKSGSMACIDEVTSERVRFTGGRMRLMIGTAARYFTMPPCGDSLQLRSQVLCLFFKNSLNEQWVGAVTSADGGRSFLGDAELVMPAYHQLAYVPRTQLTTWGLPRPATLTHNYAIIRLPNGSYFMVGGRHRLPRRNFDGVWFARGASWRWNDSVPTSLEPVYRGQGVYEALKVRDIHRAVEPETCSQQCIVRSNALFAAMLLATMLLAAMLFAAKLFAAALAELAADPTRLIPTTPCVVTDPRKDAMVERASHDERHAPRLRRGAKRHQVPSARSAGRVRVRREAKPRLLGGSSHLLPVRAGKPRAAGRRARRTGEHFHGYAQLDSV